MFETTRHRREISVHCVEGRLRELAAEAGKSLSPTEVSTLVDEARTHLEESIQARLELGATREQAETDALAAFGSAQVVGEEVRRTAPFDRRLLQICVALAAFWAVALAVGPVPDFVAFALMLLFFVLHGAFLFVSARARRFRVATISAVLVPFWIFGSIVSSWNNVSYRTEYGLSRLDRSTLGEEVYRARAAVGLQKANADAASVRSIARLQAWEDELDARYQSSTFGAVTAEAGVLLAYFGPGVIAAYGGLHAVGVVLGQAFGRRRRRRMVA